MRWSALGAALMFSAECLAQQPGATLNTCFEAALRRSATLATQGERVYQAKEIVTQAKGSILPSIDATASYLWQDAPQTGIGETIFPATQPLVKLTASQPLFRGFREFAALKQSRSLSEAELLDYQQLVIQLFDTVAQSFYRALSLRSQVENIGEELAVMKKRIRELEARRRIGQSRPSEVLTVQASMAKLRSQLQDLGGQLSVEQETLSFLTGLPASTRLHDPELEKPIPPLQDLAFYLARVPERPGIKALRAREEAASHAFDVARGAHLPSLDLTGNYYLQRSGTLKDVGWDLKVELTLPIYNGGVIQSKVRQAGSFQRQAENAATDQTRLAIEEIRSRYAEVSAGRETLTSLLDAERLASRNYAVQSREYRLGLVNNVEVLQALIDQAEIRRTLDHTKIDVRLARERLDAAAALKPEAKAAP